MNLKRLGLHQRSTPPWSLSLKSTATSLSRCSRTSRKPKMHQCDYSQTNNVTNVSLWVFYLSGIRITHLPDFLLPSLSITPLPRNVDMALSVVLLALPNAFDISSTVLLGLSFIYLIIALSKADKFNPPLNPPFNPPSPCSKVPFIVPLFCVIVPFNPPRLSLNRIMRLTNGGLTSNVGSGNPAA